jgi:hypothetical protein
MLKRPGIIIPVFFLALVHTTVTGQVQWPVTASAALGGCYVTMQGYSCASQNQAGLGFIEQSSVSIQHCRPFLLKELGISSLSGQFTTGSGAIGIAMDTQGLTGFRQSSLWLSYGMKLHPNMSAGVGIHFWNSTIEEQFIYAPGISFALGLQIRINDQWNLGGQLFHPAGWSALPGVSSQKQLAITAGCSYSFLRAGLFYSELHIKPIEGIILCNGLEWIVNPHTIFRTGVSNRPFTFSWGVSLKFTKWVMEFSFQYRNDSGLAPLTSLTHAW